jgi:quercetin dioxygenase-like cupin family protein
MALQHAIPGEVINAAPLGADLTDTTTRALIKTSELEIIRVVLKAGKTMAPHSVPGTVTIQCIEGHVQVAHERVSELRPQQVLLIDGGRTHSLRALEDSSLLLTIVLHSRH